MDLKQFKENELVAFIGKDQTGEIYTVEIGKIKKLCEDGAFVWYHTGDTAAKTNYTDLYKIKNLYAIDNLGGLSDEKIHGIESLQMSEDTLKDLEKEENITILKDNNIEKEKIYDAYIIIDNNIPKRKDY